MFLQFIAAKSIEISFDTPCPIFPGERLTPDLAISEVRRLQSTLGGGRPGDGYWAGWVPVQQLGQGGGTGLGAGTRAEVGLVPAGGITGNKVRKVLYLVEQNSHILVSQKMNPILMLIFILLVQLWIPIINPLLGAHLYTNPEWKFQLLYKAPGKYMTNRIYICEWPGPNQFLLDPRVDFSLKDNLIDSSKGCWSCIFQEPTYFSIGDNHIPGD